MISNRFFPRLGRCLVFAPARTSCYGCRTIEFCPYYDCQGLTMNYLNLIALILQVAVEELPVVAQIIASIEGATPAHIAAANTVVAAALKKPTV